MEISNISIPIITALFFIAICTFNLISVVFLIKAKKFHQSRFHVIVLSLSVSDFCGGAAVGLRVLFNYVYVSYACYLCEWIIYISTLVSLFQILSVCLERLNATFNIRKCWIKCLTSNVAMTFVISFIIICGSLGCFVHAYFADQDSGYEACTFVQLPYSYILDIPLLVGVAMIAVSYSVLIKRMHNQLTTVCLSPLNKTIKDSRSSMTEFSSSGANLVQRTKCPLVCCDIFKVLQKKKIHVVQSTVEPHCKERPSRNSIFTTWTIASPAPSLLRDQRNNQECTFDNNNLFQTIKIQRNDKKAQQKPTVSRSKIRRDLLINITTVNVKPGSSRQTTSSSQTELEELLKSKEMERLKRFRMNVITLGAIILVAFLSVIPKCVVSILMLQFPNLTSGSKIHLLKLFLLLNSLLDPFIYVLRIKEFRNCLTPCKHSKS